MRVDERRNKNNQNNPNLKKIMVDYLNWDKMKIYYGAFVVLIISVIMYMYIYFTSEKFCDMDVPSNRDFNKYYGIPEGKNPFGKLNAEYNSADLEIFKPIITEQMKAPSMILKGDYGSGKTSIREHLIKESKNQIIVKIYGNKPSFNYYFESFAQDRKAGKAAAVINDFNSVDFMNIILSELTSTILSIKFQTYNNKLASLTFEQRFKIVSILSFYSHPEAQQDSLLNLVNNFLPENPNCYLLMNCGKLTLDEMKKIEFQEKNRHTNRYEDVPELTDAYKLYNSIRIFDKDHKEKNAIFLFRIGKHFKMSAPRHLDPSPFTTVSTLSHFIKNIWNERFLIVVDSIDELFFDLEGKKAKKPDKELLQAFIDSSVTQDILKFALGVLDDVLYNILIFLPSICGLKTENWFRHDKIPINELKWDENTLNNYADYLLHYLAKHKSSGCKRIPSFSMLLNGTDVSVHALRELKTPRDLHKFMNYLIKIMNDNVLNRSEKFIASREDVNEAIKKIKENIIIDKCN